MKFTCEKQALLSAVTNTSGAVAVKNAIPALEGIFLRAEDTLRLTGYNLEMGITADVEADIAEEGEVVLSARLFGDIIRKLPDDIISVSCDKTLLVEIRCGISEFRIMGISPDDYPDLPAVAGENSFTIGSGTLASMISQTVFSVSESETRPIHTGCLFTVEQDLLTVAAVDSFRLAVRKEKIDCTGGFSFVVPGTSLKEAAKILGAREEAVKVTLGKSHVLFEIGGSCLISRVLEGQFLDYEKVIPETAKVKVAVNRAGFMDCVERVALVISEKYRTYIRCVFGYNNASMAAATAVGSSRDEVSVAGDGGDLTIGFNSRYMLEAMKNAPASELMLEMNNPDSPIVIRPADPEDESFTFMVMPIRLSN